MIYRNNWVTEQNLFYFSGKFRKTIIFTQKWSINRNGTIFGPGNLEKSIREKMHMGPPLLRPD